MASEGWWTRFFEGAALEPWRRAFSRDESRGQAHDLVRALGLVRGERVLDVPCGNARLGLELAALGLGVSGLDASRELLEEGRRQARERGLELELVQGDMRALPWCAELDAAFCAGNSFGYFDDEGNQAFLAGMARALVEGGRLWLEYPLVAELVHAREELRDWQLLGERIVLSEAALDAAGERLETSYTFVDLARPGGALETRTASYRVYGLAELMARLESAGFTALEALGEDQRSAFGPGARELWVRARRA